jgi:hypothetical protein
MANSVALGGQKGGLRLQEDSTIYYYVNGPSAYYNSFINAVTNNIDVQTGLSLKAPASYDLASITAQTTGAYKSTILAAAADAKLTDPFNNATPNLKPAAGSPLLSGALFDFGKLDDAFFEKVSYRGALDASNDWTTGWSVWNK